MSASSWFYYKNLSRSTVTRTSNLTFILLNHHFINSVRNCNIFQLLKGHLQGEKVTHSSSVGQQHESQDVKFKLLCSE